MLCKFRLHQSSWGFGWLLLGEILIMDPQGLSLLIYAWVSSLSLSNDMGRDNIVVLMLLNSTTPALILLLQPRLFQALQGGFHDVLPWNPPTVALSSRPGPCRGYLYLSTSSCFQFGAGRLTDSRRLPDLLEYQHLLLFPCDFGWINGRSC